MSDSPAFPTPLDLRYAFLVRAAARLQLVDSCDLTLDQAVHDLVPAMEEIIGWRLVCPCVRLDAPRPKIRRAA
jgi:hypothetical protein